MHKCKTRDFLPRGGDFSAVNVECIISLPLMLNCIEIAFTGLLFINICRKLTIFINKH